MSIEQGIEQEEAAAPPEPPSIPTQIIRQSRAVSAVPAKKGLLLSFVVSEGGELVQHTYIVGEQGKAAIFDAATGGIEIARGPLAGGQP